MILKFLTLFLVLVLIAVLFQDMKKRTIHIILPILIFAIALIINYYTIILTTESILYNAFFIIINITGLIIYYSIKSKKFVNPIDNFIGLGDILFFFALTPLFNFKPFILFFITGLIFSLIVHSIINLFKSVKTIPLAGYLSLFLIVNLIVKNVLNINLFN